MDGNDWWADYDHYGPLHELATNAMMMMMVLGSLQIQIHIELIRYGRLSFRARVIKNTESPKKLTNRMLLELLCTS